MTLLDHAPGAARAAGAGRGKRWKDWPDEQKRALIEKTQERIARLRRATWKPYPWQVAPAHVDAHGAWMLLGGRGTGKTDAGAQYVLDHVNGPPCDPRLPGGHRLAIIAPTLGDAAESCVNGPSGLKTHDPRVRMVSTKGGTFVYFANGSVAKLFGAYTAEDVERLRAGGNRCMAWLEEAAAQRQLAAVLEHTGLGLRIGDHPHYAVTTTPKPRKEIRELAASPRTVLSSGKTSQAFHLPAAVREALYEKHKGTRLEAQELDGVLIDEVQGALWSWKVLDRWRVTTAPTGLTIVVAVDPAVSNTEKSDETGIVVVGARKEDDGQLHAYVLDDVSGRYDPEQWAALVVETAKLWDADRVVVERNQGGDLVKANLRAAEGGKGLTIRDVTATKGKRLRADPISTYSARGRVHHVGSLVELEQQLTTWVPPMPGEKTDDSPDRLDAFVYAVTDLLDGRRGGFAGAA